MEHIFFTILGMSGTASVVILVVVLARLVLRRAPKVFSYALWTVVLFRLLCPFTFRSPWGVVLPVRVEPTEKKVLSVETSTAEITIQVGGTTSAWEPVPAEDLTPAASFVPAEALSPDVSAPVPATPAALDWRTIAGVLWLTGVLLLLGYSAVSLLFLRRRLIGSIPLAGEKSVWLADHIPSPFVLGLARPRIYLPSDLPEQERDYILLHERTHIRRFDHVTRALAWIALSVHWFNPLVWLAFHLAGKDMEMSCDEAVLRKMGRDIRADYSTSLLRLAVGGRLPAGPLAFGGGEPQSRIKNVLKYKKPAFWVVAAALIAVLCAGVALATNQNGLVIDSDSIISATSFNSSSYTITPERTIIYTPADRQKDLQDQKDARTLSLEDGRELVRLINTYHKTVYGQGELTLNAPHQRFTRLNCADGSFYLVNYWLWHGFNFNPFHEVGEDDYTTLVTYYDAQGNAGTTWQMEYDFDNAFQDWYYPIIQRRDEPPRFSLEELADSLSADLTFTLDQSQLDGSPFVRVSGTVDGVELSRVIWDPEGENSLLGEHPGGELTMEYRFESGGATLGAWWADEAHTSVTLSTKITTLYSSYIPNGWWEFTVDLAAGAVTSMESHPMESTLSAPVKLYPESITDKEGVQVARIMAVVMQAAEDYYNKSTPEVPTLNPSYSTSESLNPLYYVDVNGLDCDEAVWRSDASYKAVADLWEIPDHGLLGLLQITNPRFFGGRFAKAQGFANVGYFPNDGAPLVFVSFNDYDYLPLDSYSGWKRGKTETCFIVELTSGAVRVPPDREYEPLDSGLSDEEAVSLAWALIPVIQGAADFYAENCGLPFSLTPSYSLDSTGSAVIISGLDCDEAIWRTDVNAPHVGSLLYSLTHRESALGSLTIKNPRFLGALFKTATGTTTTFYYPDEEFQLFNAFEGYTPDSAGLKHHSFLVDLDTGIGTHKSFSGFPDRTVPIDDYHMLVMGRALAEIIQGAADYYTEATGASPISTP